MARNILILRDNLVEAARFEEESRAERHAARTAESTRQQKEHEAELEMAEKLIANGCDSVQGYFYSHPLPQQEFLDFVARQDFHTQRRRALEIVI